jgi:uncharacterized protein YbjT (DUF2867 family)
MATKNDRLILVTGATGNQGGAAARHLRERGFPIRVLTRNPDQPKARAFIGHGAEVVRGDLEDPASLTRALEGVYGVFSVQKFNTNMEAEIREGTNLADAAMRSRVSHFVYSSVGAADQNTGIPHFDSKFQIERHIRGTGFPFTILRPVFFMENWLGLRTHLEQGTLALPLGPHTRLQMIAVDDIGGFVATAFEHPGRWQGRAVDIAGDELSMTELVEAFSRVTGRQIRYVQMPWEEFEPRTGHEMTVMYRWFENVGYHVDIPSLRQQYPNLITFEHWLHGNWQSASAAASQA